MEYDITATETHRVVYRIEANSEEQARELFWDRFDHQEISDEMVETSLDYIDQRVTA